MISSMHHNTLCTESDYLMEYGEDISNYFYYVNIQCMTFENELIYSMMRNLPYHRAEEMKNGLNWTLW